MKYLQSIAFALIIGSIVAASTYSYQEASAMEDYPIIEKMIEVDKKLSDLNSMNAELNELSMSKISFKINQIKNMLLEINNANDGNNEKIDTAYTYLSNNYVKAFDKYHNNIKKYQNENGLTIQEKKLVSEVFKNKSVFETIETQQNIKKLERELIEKAVKETKAKKDYQKLVNKIGMNLADDANGGKVDNIHHKLAIKEIIESKKWEIAIPAIDRVIVQTNDDYVKGKLVDIKNNIGKILEKREKHDNNEQIFSLKNNEKISQIELIQYNVDEMVFGGILDQFDEGQILSSLIDSEKIISEFELQQDSESTISKSEKTFVIEPIFESELVESLEEVAELSDDEDSELEKEREKQRKDARESKNNKKSNKVKETTNDKPSNDKPSNDKPSNDKPSNDKPSNDKPSNDKQAK
jgi:hypothetical protein